MPGSGLGVPGNGRGLVGQGVPGAAGAARGEAGGVVVVAFVDEDEAVVLLDDVCVLLGSSASVGACDCACSARERGSTVVTGLIGAAPRGGVGGKSTGAAETQLGLTLAAALMIAA